MLKKLVVIMLLLGISINQALANNFDTIRDCIKQNFPADLHVTQAQLRQLSWTLGHRNRTYEMDVLVENKKVSVELMRALTRLYCLQLLKSGGKASYNNFIRAQINDNNPYPLAFNSFNKLSKQIQHLNQEDYALLTTATILSAVSLSPQASMLAQDILNIDCIPNDSLDFLATTLRKQNNIYPIVTSKKLLYVLFPPQTNFRHMFYAEGGIGMFKYLRTMIKHRYIKEAELNLWYCFWALNIAGFRGHIDHNGSIYLDEQVFQSMQKLKFYIEEMLQSPNFDPLVPYLNYRAQLLGFEYLPQQEKLLLAHLGAMMRLYTVEDGRQLRIGFYKLPKHTQQQISKYFLRSLQDSELYYPTYAPALFSNILEINSRNIQQAIAAIIPLYLKTMELYNQELKSGNIKPGTYLSFNKLSSSFNIKKLLRINAKDLSLITISVDGEVVL